MKCFVQEGTFYSFLNMKNQEIKESRERLILEIESFEISKKYSKNDQERIAKKEKELEILFRAYTNLLKDKLLFLLNHSINKVNDKTAYNKIIEEQLYQTNKEYCIIKDFEVEIINKVIMK